MHASTCPADSTEQQNMISAAAQGQAFWGRSRTVWPSGALYDDFVQKRGSLCTGLSFWGSMPLMRNRVLWKYYSELPLPVGTPAKCPGSRPRWKATADIRSGFTRVIYLKRYITRVNAVRWIYDNATILNLSWSDALALTASRRIHCGRSFEITSRLSEGISKNCGHGLAIQISEKDINRLYSLAFHFFNGFGIIHVSDALFV